MRASGIVTLAVCLALVLGLGAPALAEDVSVRGYFRQDGTYVQPHMRTAPDRTPFSNYSTSPNINPYTGQQGTKHPELVQPNSGVSGFGSGTGLGGQRRGRSLFGSE